VSDPGLQLDAAKGCMITMNLRDGRNRKGQAEQKHGSSPFALRGVVPVTTVYARHIPSAEDAVAMVLERAIVGVS
jgi:hypothetical protein